MSSGGIFTGLDTAMTKGFDSVLQGQMALYSTLMAGLVTGSVTLYIFWRAYQTLAGKLKTPVEDILWDLARMGIILAFVTNASGYLDATVAAIDGLKNGFTGSSSVWALMDTVWAKAQDIGQTLYIHDDSTYVKLNGGFAEFLVWAGTIVTLMIATVVNLGAEITLKLMSVTAPIFIFCLMYGWLRPMFNNWLQTIFSAILTVLFSALSVRLAIDYLNGRLAVATSGADANNIVTLGAECCLAGIGAGFVIWLSAKIASSLAGAGVQGAMQGAAKAFGSQVTRSGTKGLQQTGGKAADGLGATGSKAADNLTSTPKLDPHAASRAAVEKMKARNP
jgi:type IV secretion system protein VirB6